jgi:drug/metabolite transporter (DMT)-like permease
VVAIVLAAAVLHVTWNTLVKVSVDGYLATVLIATAGAVLCGVALPFLPSMHPQAWINVAGSVVAQSIYYPLVAATYRAGDMSQTYPLMRGTAPLIVAVLAGPLIGERLHPAGWVGVLLICAGIWAMALRRQPPTVPKALRRNSFKVSRATALALLNALVIAAYTLIDGAGSRVSGAPATYTAWIFLFTAVPMLVVAIFRSRRALVELARRQWWLAAIGGPANVGAYGLVLQAVTCAPVASVAALRETSILFATVVARYVLKERVDRYRVGGTVLIAIGAVVLRSA